MMKWIKSVLAAASLVVSTSTLAMAPAPCTGEFFNPITDTDWNYFFPITIAGAQITSGSNTSPPLMLAMPPVCTCPTIFGFPFVGVGITYWQPVYIAEIERRPGCLSSLGGLNMLDSYSMLHSEQTTSDGLNHGASANRMQIHWYEYPLFSMLDIVQSLGCVGAGGFNLAYMTEVDPMWQDDTWGAIFAPEASLFSSPVASAACAVDATASSFYHPLDALFWCAGSWGNIYPLSGNSSHSGDPFTMNNQILAKFIARNHRMGLSMQTIGPSAICMPHPNPVWVKSQYRYNQVAPINRRGRAVGTGSQGRMLQYPPVTNPPTQEHTVNLIWQGQQCCAKGIP